jgi:hypothetical protein
MLCVGPYKFKIDTVKLVIFSMIAHRGKAMITYLCLIQEIWVQSSAQKSIFIGSSMTFLGHSGKFLYGPVN